jgi:prepilin-type N-terminal cleavage/methylation domain-containing protein/prepilin-type processing-associated H-X9-DG protein
MNPVLAADTARRRPAFTLIELLVVVAIITLLMSILTPSLSRARQQAKSTVCLTRLREFMNALTAYGNDYQGQLPPMRYKATCKPDSRWHGWAEALYMDLYRDKDFSLEDDYPVQRNLTGRYELWVCKEAQPLANSTGHYRVYFHTWATGSLDAVKPRLPLIADANPLVTDTFDLKFSCINPEHIAGLVGESYIDERHYGGANYAFSDGHAVRDTALKERLAEDWDLDALTLNADMQTLEDLEAPSP